MTLAARVGPGDASRRLRRHLKDAQSLDETSKLDLPMAGPLTGLEAEQIVASIYAASPALLARAQAVVVK